MTLTPEQSLLRGLNLSRQCGPASTEAVLSVDPPAGEDSKSPDSEILKIVYRSQTRRLKPGCKRKMELIRMERTVLAKQRVLRGETVWHPVVQIFSVNGAITRTIFV